MPLQVGDVAPNFDLPAHDNAMTQLESLRGQTVVLLFFPAAFTSVCTTEMCSVGENLAAYDQANAKVFAISVDSPFTLNRFREDTGAEFTFLSDFNRTASKAYGVVREGPLGPGLLEVADRAAFVIGPDGKIAYAWHSTNPGNLPPLDEVLEAAQKAG